MYNRAHLLGKGLLCGQYHMHLHCSLSAIENLALDRVLTYITPKLMLPASKIFSRRDIFSPLMNIQGKAARKKSHTHDQAGLEGHVSIIFNI